MTNTKETFWSKVNKKKDDECWEWQAGCCDEGYGKFMFECTVYRAHRLAYKFTHNYLPSDSDVLHTCDNPKCCNPNHLYLGTQKNNMEDRNNKHRQALGEHNGKSKLTSEQVLEIRKLYSSGKYTHQTLSVMFNISRQNISFILSNQGWKHI